MSKNTEEALLECSPGVAMDVRRIRNYSMKISYKYRTRQCRVQSIERLVVLVVPMCCVSLIRLLVCLLMYACNQSLQDEYGVNRPPIIYKYK